MVAKSEFHEIDTGVAEVLHEPDGSMVLLVNGVPSSHIVPGEPERLDFEYMRWIADFLDTHYPDEAKSKSRITHLGGGACTLARYFASRWKGSRSTVVEIAVDLHDRASRALPRWRATSPAGGRAREARSWRSTAISPCSRANSSTSPGRPR